MKSGNICDWFLRVLKGALIGMDFVLPGVSGSALAVVFGLYERIVETVAHITKNFVQNILFFIPVGIGGTLGVFLISHPMSFLLKNHQTQVLWFFVGTILGTLPDIWQKSGEKGRKPRHIIIMILTFILGTAFLLFSGNWGFGQFALNPLIAFFAGSSIALVALIPGLSSSNFLVLFGLYESMIDAYKSLNFTVIVPFFAGLAICILPFSKGIEFLFKKAFTGFFHFVVGIVLASTVLIAAIASEGYNYLQIGSIVCAASSIAGIVFAYWMCQISKKYEIKKGG
ncbi:MAG: DUF368 domain-containing protein [Chitinispirillales bacterium]|jgi:putative membrane protein|nr:DUF368 domain-containing protein [Chitinispirillales bacterium]